DACRHPMSSEKQNGQTGPGGRCDLPQFPQVGSISRCARQPCQNRSLSGPMRGRGFRQGAIDLSPYPARITESPHAVPHCSTAALAIWLAPAVPRNCLTISQIEFHPATWASERSPPDVLTGSAPPSSMPPPCTHAAASPAPQYPNRSSANSTNGENAS